MFVGDGRRFVGDWEAVRTVGSTVSKAGVEEPEAMLERRPRLIGAKHMAKSADRSGNQSSSPARTACSLTSDRNNGHGERFS